MKKTNLDCNKLSNYRPISQLPLLSKIIEKIVSRQIIEYLLFHNLFDEYQNAYRPGHSTETTLLKISDDILKYVDNSDSVQLILLDLSCAFDSLDHSIIIDRITSIGFTGSSLDWIISYLSNRTYYINIKGLYSPIGKLRYGVPQGSVLGPLLFSIYIIPLSLVIKNFSNIHYAIYADDIQLYYKVNKQSNTELNDCIEQVRSWLIFNNLFPNSSKTKLINITTKSCIFPNVLFDSTIIEPSEYVTSLGVTLDSKLSFSRFISSICKSANYNLYNIR